MFVNVHNIRLLGEIVLSNNPPGLCLFIRFLASIVSKSPTQQSRGEGKKGNLLIVIPTSTFPQTRLYHFLLWLVVLPSRPLFSPLSFALVKSGYINTLSCSPQFSKLNEVCNSRVFRCFNTQKGGQGS
jgi:hypothetical protein